MQETPIYTLLLANQKRMFVPRKNIATVITPRVKVNLGFLLSASMYACMWGCQFCLINDNSLHTCLYFLCFFFFNIITLCASWHVLIFILHFETQNNAKKRAFLLLVPAHLVLLVVVSAINKKKKRLWPQEGWLFIFCQVSLWRFFLYFASPIQMKKPL